MSSGNSLSREARPYFRQESPEDIPLLIPRGLGQQGRSALVPSGTRRTVPASAQSPALARPQRCRVAIAGHGRWVVGVRPAQHSDAGAVRAAADFRRPGYRTTAGSLSHLVGRGGKAGPQRALRQSKGDGSGGCGSHYGPCIQAANQNPGARHRSRHSRWPCAVSKACVCSRSSREQAGTRFHQQGVLFSDMTLQQWRDIVHSTTLALYR